MAEFLRGEGIDIPIRHVGLPDHFVEHGGQDAIRHSAGLSAAAITDAVYAWSNSAQARTATTVSIVH